jgi:MoaA/NifB/PqqE/SkfB family radical SAM enzyme
MAAYAAHRGVRVSINTNLSLLNRARAARCADCGLDTVHVSIDGATAETYERIRVRARFSTLLRNLGHLMDVQKKRGRPNVRIVTVAMRQNIHELADIVRLAKSFGVPSVFVQHLAHDFGESSLPAHYKPMRQFVQAQTLLEEDAARIEKHFSDAAQTARDLDIDLRLPPTRARPHAPGTPGKQRCDWPWRGAYVSYQGLAMPCCMVATPDRIHFGSMAKDGVDGVWSGPDYEDFRRRLDSDDPPEVCKSCAVYNGTF